MKEKIIKITFKDEPEKCRGERPKYIYFNEEWNEKDNND